MSFFSLFLTAVVAAQSALAGSASSSSIFSCARLSAGEKAQCLVQLRKQTLNEMAKSSVSVSSKAVTMPVLPTLSCSRLQGKEKGDCLVKQRKQVLGIAASSSVSSQKPPCSTGTKEEQAKCRRLKSSQR